MSQGGEEFVRVAALSGVVEAQVLSEVLTDRGVPHRIHSFRDVAYGALFQAQGWGQVEAPEAVADEIREVLGQVRAAG
jgi:hypothetical protein